MKIHIIGVGGVGGWLVRLLVGLPDGDTLVLWDGDKVEEHNLARQFFSRRDIGRNKALATKRQLIRPACIEAVTRYYGGELDSEPYWLLCCVDNHATRLRCLTVADGDPNCRGLISGANETKAVEVFYYDRELKGTPADPRRRCPEILSPDAHDPLASCTGPLAEARFPQLASVNAQAASLMEWMFRWYSQEVLPETRPYSPVLVRVTPNGIFVTQLKNSLGDDHAR